MLDELNQEHGIVKSVKKCTSLDWYYVIFIPRGAKYAGWPIPNSCLEEYCLRSIFGPLKVYLTALYQYK